MIDSIKYNKNLQKIIDNLEELKITDKYMREDNRVCCLGGAALMIEDLAMETGYEMAIPTKGWRSQKQIDYDNYRRKND